MLVVEPIEPAAPGRRRGPRPRPGRRGPAPSRGTPDGPHRDRPSPRVGSGRRRAATRASGTAGGRGPASGISSERSTSRSMMSRASSPHTASRRLDGDAPGEEREPAEGPALVVEEHLVAPVDGRAQALVAGLAVASAAPQQVEPVVEAVGDLGQPERLRAAPRPARSPAGGGRGGGTARGGGRRPRRRRTPAAPPSARWRNSAAASASANGRRGTCTSPLSPSGSRLVARTVSAGQLARSGGGRVGRRLAPRARSCRGRS